MGNGYSACIVTSLQHGFVGGLSKKKHKHTTWPMGWQPHLTNEAATLYNNKKI